MKLPTNYITDAHVVDLPALHKVVECSECLLQWSAIIPAVCLGGERKGKREGRKRERERRGERGKEEREKGEKEGKRRERRKERGKDHIVG